MEEQKEIVQTNALVLILDKSELEQSKKEFILQKFQDFYAIADDWKKKAETIVVTKPEQKTEMKMAKEGRIFLKNKRIEVEKARKHLKEQSLQEGRTIDGIANSLKALIEPIETYLEEQEKFIEIQENKRKELLKAERIKKFEGIEFDFTGYDFGVIEEEAFQNILSSAIAAHNKKIEDVLRAKEERIEKEKEAERLRLENEKILQEKKELEEKLAEQNKIIEQQKAEALRTNFVKGPIEVHHPSSEPVEIVSECCGVPMTGEMVDYGFCPACHEHATVIDLVEEEKKANSAVITKKTINVFEIEYRSDKFKENGMTFLGDTGVYIEENYICTIAGDDLENFNVELEELINKYKI